MDGVKEMRRFGDFIKEKRLKKEINLRKLAEMLDVAPAYISDIEKGKRNSPAQDKMEKLVEILSLTEEEKNEMYDLAAKDRENAVAPDISDYIKTNDTVRVALRKARNLNLGEQEWLKIIEEMENGENDK